MTISRAATALAAAAAAADLLRGSPAAAAAATAAPGGDARPAPPVLSVPVGASPVILPAEEVARTWVCAYLRPGGEDRRGEDWRLLWMTLSPFHELQVRIRVEEGGAEIIGGTLPRGDGTGVDGTDVDGADEPPAASAVAERAGRWCPPSRHAELLWGYALAAGLVASPLGDLGGGARTTTTDERRPLWAEVSDALLPGFCSASVVPCSGRGATGAATGGACVVSRPVPYPRSAPVCLRLREGGNGGGGGGGGRGPIRVDAALGLSAFHLLHLAVGTVLIVSARGWSASRFVHYLAGAALAWSVGAVIVAYSMWRQLRRTADRLLSSSLPAPLGPAASYALFLSPLAFPREALWFVRAARPALAALLMSPRYVLGSSLVGVALVWWFGAFLPPAAPRPDDGEDEFYIAPDGSRVDRFDPEEVPRPASQRALGAAIALPGASALLFSTNNVWVSLVIVFAVFQRDEILYRARRVGMWTRTSKYRPRRYLNKREYTGQRSELTRRELERLRDHISSNDESCAKVRPETVARLWQFVHGAPHVYQGVDDDDTGAKSPRPWALVGWISAAVLTMLFFR